MRSYLSQKDTIHLSQTNHLFHKKTHEKSFVDCYSNGTSKNILNLSEVNISSITKTGTNTNGIRVTATNLSCNKYERLLIGSEIINGHTVPCDAEHAKCSLCTLMDFMNNNYDLQWFGDILSKTRSVELSDDWPCLWNKMPLKWL